MRLLFYIALKHFLARKRQSLVSLMGVVLGVAFFLAVSALMQGSEKDFIRRLIDNAPHITIQDEYRLPREQPIFEVYPKAAISIAHVKPLGETRGIRGFGQILHDLRKQPGVLASPTLTGEGIVSFAGRDVAVHLNGIIPDEINEVSTLANYMQAGKIEDLNANTDGIIIGQNLLNKLSLYLGESINLSTAQGQKRTFKIIGIFRTGRISYDESEVFVVLKRAQALFNRQNRVNNIIMKLPDPYQARTIAAVLEHEIGYKCVSWQEVSEDILSTLMIRNIIMYIIVSAVLIVAGFGIYNVISTVVMEKHRDIAILRSMGFYARDIQKIFTIQGIILGGLGNLMGLPLGCILMLSLMQISLKIPGSTEHIQMPIDWGIAQFLIAGSLALAVAIFSAVLPARKAAGVQPVDILRGGT